MLTELWLSQRYIKEKKEKIISFTAFISMIGIAIGVFVLIVVIGVMSGFDRFLEDKMVGSNAHMIIDAFNNQQEPYAAIAEVEKIPHVLAAAPYITGQAVVKLDKQLMIFEMRGIDPRLQPKVSKIAEYMRKGTLDIKYNQLLIGEELSLRLGLDLGSKITLISPITLAKADFSVGGIFKSGMYQYDASLLLTDIKSAQDFFKLGDAVGGLSIKVDDIYKVEAIKDEIYRDFKSDQSYEVRTWQDLNRNFLQALKLEKIVMFIVVTMTTVVAAFGIVSSLIMSVMSRIKDIGILRSVGAKSSSILQIFMYQGLRIGLSGMLLGLVGGVAFTKSLNNIIDFISSLIGRKLIPPEIYYFDRIPVYINPGDVFLIVASALVITLIASVYPAWFAARISPAEALRHE